MRVYYGWVIVAVGIVVSCIGIGTMMSLSVFLQPVSTAMGWSRAGVSAASMVAFLCLGVSSFLWGAASDRYGTRAVVMAGGVLLGVGLAVTSRAAALWQFQLLFGAIVGTAAGSSYAPLIAATSNWFTRHRSLAVALVSVGAGIGSITVAPLATWLIVEHGWRTAMLALGGVAWIVVVPVALLLRRPPVLPDDPRSAVPANTDLSVSEALRTPQFVAVAFTYFACCAAHSGPIFHMVSYAMVCGAAPLVATTVFSMAGLGGLTGRIVLGLLADRVGAKQVLVAGLAAQASAIILYNFTREIASLYALSLFFGFAYGGVMPLYAILIRQYFGARIMGATFGAAAMVSALGMAIGPLAGGWIFDEFASYTWLYTGSFAIALGALAIAITFRPPRQAWAPA
ncbi:MAG TPA: MFS transporter [Burkholderiales bacterium]|nr:MFS transporter [Burkholderiales bacterium]